MDDNYLRCNIATKETTVTGSGHRNVHVGYPDSVKEECP